MVQSKRILESARKRLVGQLNSARGFNKRVRLGKRLRAIEARLVAFTLAQS